MIMNSIARPRKKVVRIAILNSHPIQYFAPLYAHLNKAPDLDVTALYLSDISVRGGWDDQFGREVKWDLDLLEGYRSVFIGGRGHERTPAGFWSLIGPQVWSELRSGRYDVLWLHGHNYAANIIALLAAKSAGLRIMMRGETHLALPRTGVKFALRKPLLGALYGLCDRLLAIGSANAAFYKAMGVPDQKIFLVPYSVDNDRFTRTSLTNDQKADVKNRYGIPIDQPTILYAAKFTDRKRPMDLLQAVKGLTGKTARPFTLVMGGAGELEQELRAFCSEHSLQNVLFPGFINQSDLPQLYACSDVFVLPSQDEPWGLAVNEAMCAGLPIVVSREVGCVADLVENGVNGFTPDAGDIEALAAALLKLIEDEDLRRQQGQASLSRIAGWSYQECLEGVRAALGGIDSSEASLSLQRHPQ
jgi:glycosyltransferase involved in cell wall biosynthesis